MLLDILFPKTCLSCGAFGSYVCVSCAQKLEKVIQDICPYCERPSMYGKTHKSCMTPDCVDGLISVYRYRGVFAKILKGIKYKGIRSAFGNIFNTFPYARKKDVFHMVSLFPESAFIPIPLHPRRLKHRGFNQAAVIAKFFSRECGLPIEERVIDRIKFTAQQARKANQEDRFENIRGAFAMAHDARRYKDVFLVDDVWTTGATIKQAASVLKQAGCESVYAITLAR